MGSRPSPSVTGSGVTAVIFMSAILDLDHLVSQDAISLAEEKAPEDPGRARPRPPGTAAPWT
ncbi:hypothetical protein GCM10009539_26980 [Cryptosporangium japonicum]|uniref:Uncharacterized protein n=1 Tax=Cryptosporangium japonicum TaxID=80872 RepID=A0ABP3DS26_9ACTN